MNTAVVILNWNGRKWLQQFLPLVLEHTAADARVIVADNGSTDDSVAWMRQHAPGAEVIELPENTGFAGGYNAALKQVEAEYLILLNSDVEVTPGWAKSLREHLEAHPRMAACQPKMLSHHERHMFEHAGAAGGYIDRNGYPFCRGRIFNLTEKDTGQYDDDQEVFWATGACMAIRAKAFHEAGGFDARFFAHMEEIDLCWSLQHRGWRIGYTSSVTVYHVGGGALGYGNPRKTFLNFRNSLAVLTKHLDSRWIHARLLYRFLLDWMAALKFLLEGHGRHAWQVLRAQAGFLRWLPALLKERRRIRAAARSAPLTGFYRRNIAVDRYLLGRRYFSELDQQAFDHRAPRTK